MPDRAPGAARFRDADGEWVDVEPEGVAETRRARERTQRESAEATIRAAAVSELAKAKKALETETRNAVSTAARALTVAKQEIKDDANRRGARLQEKITRADYRGRTDLPDSMSLPAVIASQAVSRHLITASKQTLLTSLWGSYLTPPASAAGTVKLAVTKKAKQRSELTISGAVDSDGDVTVYAKNVGEQGIQYAHVVGATGVGEEDRALAVAVAGSDVTVTFGTDGNGDSVVPTAAQVVAVLFHVDVVPLLWAVAGGDGTGAVGAAALAPLTGGIGDVAMLAADFDLEALVAGQASEIPLAADMADRLLQPGETAYVTITSTDAVEELGVAGGLSASYRIY